MSETFLDKPLGQAPVFWASSDKAYLMSDTTKPAVRFCTKEVSADAGQTTATSKAAELKDEMDDILDEIDSVLEENAEEFVRSYVQKGGQ